MSKKILIIEDEKPLANALDLKLKSAGFDTEVVYDGEAAITVSKDSKYDLIMLDLVLPKKDGFAVLTELKSMKIKTPVMVISNLGQDEDKKRAIELGARGYFVKSDTTLAEIIEQVKNIFAT